MCEIRFGCDVDVSQTVGRYCAYFYHADFYW